MLKEKFLLHPPFESGDERDPLGLTGTISVRWKIINPNYGLVDVIFAQFNRISCRLGAAVCFRNFRTFFLARHNFGQVKNVHFHSTCQWVLHAATIPFFCRPNMWKALVHVLQLPSPGRWLFTAKNRDYANQKKNGLIIGDCFGLIGWFAGRLFRYLNRFTISDNQNAIRWLSCITLCFVTVK